MRSAKSDSNRSSDHPPLRGVWGFPLTPFGGGVPDLAGTQAIADRIVDGGANVICANGLVAQGDAMTPAERAGCLKAVVDSVAGRAPVVATVYDALDVPSLTASGVAAAVAVPASPAVEDILTLLDAISGARSDLPLLVYHRPPLLLQPAGLRRIAKRPMVVGLKEGHSDIRHFRRLRNSQPRKLLWVAAHEDLVLPYWALGADGHCPVSAVYAPAYTQSWAAALERGNIEVARSILSNHAYRLADVRFRRPGIDITVVKEMMRHVGFDAGDVRAPALELTPAEKGEIAKIAVDLASLQIEMAGGRR
jgi:dihydrodipicolinate synthase/N-acetylneuraminate lyase